MELNLFGQQFFFSFAYFSVFYPYFLAQAVCLEFLCRSELQRQNKNPSLQWTTATKEKSFVAVKQRDEEGYVGQKDTFLSKKYLF